MIARRHRADRVRPGHSPLAWLLAQAVVLHAVYGVVRPMVSYRALDLDAGSAQLGLLAAAFAVLPLFFAFLAGRKADTLGPGRLLVVGSVLLVLGSLTALLAGGFVVLLVASAVLGFAHLLVMVGQQSTVAALAAPVERDRGFGSLTAAASLGQMIGPALALSVAGYLAAPGRPASAVGLTVATALAVLAVPLGLRRRASRTTRRPPAPVPTMRTFAVLARTGSMWTALLTSGIALAALDLLMAFLPAWAEERGIPVMAVGWLLALRAAVSMVSRIGMVRLVARFTRRWTFVGSLVLGVAGFALLPAVGVGGAVAAMCLLGVGLGLAQPLTLSWITALAAPEIRGAAIGLRLTANRLAQTVLPPAIGVLVAGTGSTGVFLGSAIMLGAATAPLLRPGVTIDRDRSRADAASADS